MKLGLRMVLACSAWLLLSAPQVDAQTCPPDDGSLRPGEPTTVVGTIRNHNDLRGWVGLPPSVDVKSIRKGLRMTQAAFSDSFGFSLDAVKHWEGGRRTPEVPARAYLTVIQRNPSAVLEALRPSSAASRKAD